MLQTVSKCRSVFMFCVLFEHCFIIELFGLMSHDRQFEINTYLLVTNVIGYVTYVSSWLDAGSDCDCLFLLL